MDVDPLQQSIQKDPNNLSLLNFAAETYESEFELEKAGATFEKILTLEPSNISAALGMGRCLRITGKATIQHLKLLEQTQSLLPPTQSTEWETLNSEIEFFKNTFKENEPNVNSSLHSKIDSLLCFSQIGGLHNIKEKITQKILSPLNNLHLYKKFGNRIGENILFYGPPGCGKTYLCQTLLDQLPLPSQRIQIHQILSIWTGESENQLHEIFSSINNQKPSFLLFDEIDALAVNRKNLRGNQNIYGFINQFLIELDNARKNAQLFVLATTNSPWRIDSAFLRPGRFDEILFVPPPNLIEREEIFKVKLKNRPYEPSIDFAKLATLSSFFSGADIENSIHSASQLAITKSQEQNTLIPIDEQMLIQTIQQTRPTTKNWLEQAKNYVKYANQDGLYHDLALYLKSL